MNSLTLVSTADTINSPVAGSASGLPPDTGAAMGVTYFKRYRMEIDLDGRLYDPPQLPTGYELVPWREDVLEIHAQVKQECFSTELDAILFPCLGDREGCMRLMKEISRREGFMPAATWLMACRFPGRPPEYCGTVQGVRDHGGTGGIQNLGITTHHRGRGLGTALLHRALAGFLAHGVHRVYLEVTAQNTGAVRLYQRLGFYRTKTVYKAADVAYA